MKKSEEKIQYLSKVYNAYAKQYNQANNKIGITNGLSDRCDKWADDLEAMRKKIEVYGFTPEYLRMLATAIKDKDEVFLKAHNTTMQDFAERNNFTEQEFNKVVERIAEYGRQYELTEVNYFIVQRIVYVTTQNGYPENIPLWRELSENKREQISNFNLLKTEGRYELYQKLYHDNSETWQNVFKIFCKEIEKKTGFPLDEEYDRFHDKFKKWRAKNN